MSLWNARIKNKVMSIKDIKDLDVIIATDVRIFRGILRAFKVII